MDASLILLMALLAAWSGGSLWPSQHLPKKLTWVPEALFSLGFVWALFPLIGYWSILAGGWSYIWMQTGHTNALPWGKGNHNPERSNTLQPIVDKIADKLGFERFDVNWCRTFFAVKGCLITLPVGGLGLILWPLGYELGNRIGKHVWCELLSGAGAGVSILIFISIF